LTGRMITESERLLVILSHCVAGSRVVDLNAHVAHCALNLPMPQEKLNCPQIAIRPPDQSRGMPEMRAHSVSNSSWVLKSAAIGFGARGR
jgi:hypothetical protein